MDLPDYLDTLLFFCGLGFLVAMEYVFSPKRITKATENAKKQADESLTASTVDPSEHDQFIEEGKKSPVASTAKVARPSRVRKLRAHYHIRFNVFRTKTKF